MHPLIATIATLILFVAPGVLFVAVLGGSKKRVALSLGEQLYLVLSGSLLVSGWAALFLAELGRFSSLSTAAFVGGLVLLGTLFARKRLSFRLGSMGWDEIAVLVCLVGFGLTVYFPPFEYVLGGRDPGVYVNAGFHLAREGNLSYVDPVILSIPEEERSLFFRVDQELPQWSQPRFLGFHMESPDTGRVVPQGLHLYPVWIGIASHLFEMKAGLYATPFFALMGVAGLFFALRRLFDAEVALWASGMMAVFQIQIWFARFPNAEILVQFLFVTGLLAFYFMDEERSSLAGLLGGVAFGTTLLVRVENLLFLVPLGLYLGWRRLRRELHKPELAFLGGFLVVGLHAVLHARLIAWPYVSNVLGRHYWRVIGENLALFAVAAIVAFLLVDRLGTKLVARIAPSTSTPKARAIAAGMIFLIALYAYFIRPVWHGARTAPHDAEAFLRMSWYLYPMGLSFVVAGAMLLLARTHRRQALFVLVGLTFSLFFFYKVRVWHDHYFAMRRFIPVILPCFFACIAVFLVSLRAARGWIGNWAPRIVGSLLLISYFIAGRPLWGHQEFPGSLDFVTELARHIGDRDVVIFPRREGLHLLELPLSELEGKNVLEFYGLSPDRDSLERLIASWSDEYEDVYFVTNYKISLSGLFTQHVRDFSLGTEHYEYAYTRPPAGPKPFHLRFTLSKAVDVHELAERMPKIDRIDVGGSDDLLVAWFFEKERVQDGTSYRWSQKTSSVFLPSIGPESKEILIRMAGPEEPAAPLNAVTVSVDEQELATLQPERDFETYRVELPAELTSNLDDDFAILRLGTETWRPNNSIPGATDIRDLGVRIDWIEVR